MKQKLYRHGEVCFTTIDKLPENLKETKTDTILTGSNNNPHNFVGGKIYFKDVDNFIFGYFHANKTILKHREHGDGKGKIKTAKIPNGFYELRKANEVVNKELRQIKD